MLILMVMVGQEYNFTAGDLVMGISGLPHLGTLLLAGLDLIFTHVTKTGLNFPYFGLMCLHLSLFCCDILFDFIALTFDRVKKYFITFISYSKAS